MKYFYKLLFITEVFNIDVTKLDDAFQMHGPFVVWVQRNKICH